MRVLSVTYDCCDEEYTTRLPYRERGGKAGPAPSQFMVGPEEQYLVNELIKALAYRHQCNCDQSTEEEEVA